MKFPVQLVSLDYSRVEGLGWVGCGSDKEVVCEGVVYYVEQAATLGRLGRVMP